MPIFDVRHVTRYAYARPVAFGEHRMMMRPRDSYDQKLVEAWLDISPRPASFRWMHDVFGNCVAIAAFAGLSDRLSFESTITVDHSATSAPDFEIEDYARLYPFSYGAEEQADLMPSIARGYADPEQEVHRWVRRFLRSGKPTETGELLMTLTYAIKESFSYERRSAQGTQAPATTLLLGRGTCRDFALLMMEAVRSLGLAARFVTGYIYVPSRDRPEYLGGGSTHAWCQVYVPGSGWVEFDPTNGIVGNRDLIRVAVTRDPGQAIPLWGTWSGNREDALPLEVEVQVQRRDLPADAAFPHSDSARRVAEP
jgi:transglutaminase-like putative cysteine protease